MEHTRIIIRHETTEALKSSLLWQQIMAVDDERPSEGDGDV